MMQQLIGDFSNHLKKAIEIGSEAEFKPSKNSINSVLICGLGGSGIGGTIISQLIKNDCRVPVVVNKDYFIPEFVNESTLVICCSYSGNTEETLSMFKDASAKNAEICIITSGGKFKEIARKHNLNVLEIPGGLPPRAAFGLSFPQLIFVFEKYKLITNNYNSSLKNAISLIDNEEENIKSIALGVSKKLVNKLPIIYSEANLEGVSIRFRQQMNENSKMLSWHNVVPELNHNELVGWRTENQEYVLVVFRSHNEYYRNSERIKYLKGVVKNYTNNTIEINSKGNSMLEECIYLIHLGDWVSYYLAELRGIDPIEIAVINGLKTFLAELD